MLIVSKFHDYYDTASIYGVDKTCVYKRTEKKVTIKEDIYSYSDRWPYSESYVVKSTRYEVDKRLLGFCGEIYPVVCIAKKPYSDPEERIYLYSAEAVAEFMVKEEISPKKRRYYFSERDYPISSEVAMSKFFDQNNWNKLKTHFAEHHCPVFIYGRGFESNRLTLVLNPSLKQLRFMQVKDPQTAFQDVYMYLSGVLGVPVEKPKPIDDKIMAASKGHDGPYSFKKPPGKGRWR